MHQVVADVPNFVKVVSELVTVQSWEGELAEVGLGMASGGSGGYVIYLEWMGKSTSALPTGIC